ncbi:hypothetical protein FRC18_001087 [Serendipita sp. 400]|nr:hypothetical protein FRC18_001087 [Serendipita sp. 400]
MERHILDLCDRFQGAVDAESKLRFLDAIADACAMLKDDIQLGDEMDVVEEEGSIDILDPKPVDGSDRINNLPSEMLLNILKLHLASEHVKRNADLMLVCKKWKELVASTPSFWNRIEAAPHSSLRNVEACTLMVDYCIRKSDKMPLDLTLDLRRLWDPRNEPQERVGPYLFVQPWEEHYDDDVIQSISETAIQSFLSYTSDLIQAFIGGSNPRGVRPRHMRRWRSFRLFLSEWMDDDYIPRIFDKFSDPAPNLETLVLSHQLNDSAWLEDTNDQLYQHVFPGLQHLREFSINAAIDLSKFRRGRNSLVSVSIVPTTVSLASLPNYPNLRTLHLALNSYRGTPPDIPGTTIALPHLTTLVVSGDHSAALLTLVNSPNIHRLRLSSPVVLNYPASPLFGLVRVLEWDILFKEDNSNETRQSLSAVLRQCILLTELVTRAGSWRPSSDPMRKMIPEILAEHPLGNLRTITYLIPGDPEFEASAVLGMVALPPQ